mmetsp:Transcript_38140/g.68405  ORF Transcript_38140/g.68405 Transcript_38140/m.68405 type:complete len:217 (+) Transcript_38140:190-840(+)
MWRYGTSSVPLAPSLTVIPPHSSFAAFLPFGGCTAPPSASRHSSQCICRTFSWPRWPPAAHPLDSSGPRVSARICTGTASRRSLFLLLLMFLPACHCSVYYEPRRQRSLRKPRSRHRRHRGASRRVPASSGRMECGRSRPISSRFLRCAQFSIRRNNSRAHSAAAPRMRCRSRGCSSAPSYQLYFHTSRAWPSWDASRFPARLRWQTPYRLVERTM